MSSMTAAIRAALDRPGWRWLLSVLASIRLSVVRRRPCRVRYRHGAWVHRYPGGTVVHPHIGARTPDQLEAATRDHYLHGYVPRPGDVVVDVGAGAGWETLTFARLVGQEGHVVAVEAHPSTFALLERMCRANRLGNVTTINVAVADRSALLTMTDLSSNLANTVIGDGGGDITVPARTLDEVLAEAEVSRVDLLKMNIEGAEGLAIAGMERAIHQTRNIVVACHDFLAEDGGPSAMRTREAVQEFLLEHGFDVHRRDDDPRPWVRDYLYARREEARGAAEEAQPKRT